MRSRFAKKVEARSGAAAGAKSFCTHQEKRRWREKKEKRRARFFFSLFHFSSSQRALHQRALNSATNSIIFILFSRSIVDGAPGPEPRGPLPRPLARVAGHAPAPAAGGALFAAVLERAKPLGADRESAAAPAELAAARPGAAAAVARGRGGLSLVFDGLFCVVVEREKREKKEVEKKSNEKKSAPRFRRCLVVSNSRSKITFALTAQASSSRFCSCLARSGSMYCASSAETSESSSSSPSNERALFGGGGGGGVDDALASTTGREQRRRRLELLLLDDDDDDASPADRRHGGEGESIGDA